MKNRSNLFLLGLMLLGCFSCGNNQNKNVTINGIDLANYEIVYSNDATSHEKTLAEKMKQAIKKEFKLNLKVKTDQDEESQYELRIGSTSRNENPNISDDQYCIGNDGDSLYFYSPTINGVVNAIEDMMVPLVYEKTIKEFNVEDKKVETVIDRSLSVMSYNVRVALNTNDDKPRPDRVNTLIKTIMPDVFGVQEASTEWMNIFKNNISDTYNYVGLGRDGGSNGEHSAVFYNTSKFKVIEGGTKWLSNTPDKVSKLPDCQYPRIVSYALLERLSDGIKFVHMNTHLDHLGGEKYETLRVNQAKVIFNIAQQYDEYPIFVTGDFNDFGKAVRDAFIEEGYTYTQQAALETENHHTYPTTLYASDASSAKLTIDYCFAKGNNYLINKYDVLTDNVNGGPTSDHYPILTDFILHKPFTSNLKIKRIIILDGIELLEGQTMPSNLEVIGVYEDGEEKLLNPSKYIVEGLNEKAHYGKTYDLKVKLVNDESINAIETLKCEKIYKDASSLKLTGNNVRVTAETEYACNEFDNNHSTKGSISMVKGMDNSTTKGNLSTMEFNVYTSKAGSYKLNYECANLNLLKGNSGYYTLDTKLSDVVELSVNGKTIDISSIIIKGHTTPSNLSNAASALARCFQVLEIDNIDLKTGENLVCIKGKTDCTLRNTYNEIPVPNTKSFSMSYNG